MGMRKKSANIGRGENPPVIDVQRRYEHICTAAFYKASARQFVPGHELDDWLQAEAEYDAQGGASA